jgi:hypothetical protein
MGVVPDVTDDFDVELDVFLLTSELQNQNGETIAGS